MIGQDERPIWILMQFFSLRCHRTPGADIDQLFEASIFDSSGLIRRNATRQVSKRRKKLPRPRGIESVKIESRLQISFLRVEFADLFKCSGKKKEFGQTG